MLALIDIIFDTVGNGVIANETFGRMISVTTLTLKRSVGLRVEALAGERALTKIAHKTRVVIVVILVQ